MGNRFHINYPYFGAWTKYGWKVGDWGIGLNKFRVDKLAEQNKDLIVSYYTSSRRYMIKAKKVQTYPVERVKDYDMFVYIIPKSVLKPIKEERSISQMSTQEFFAKYS